MCTPTTGSPTITLFQLRSNYHTVYNSPGNKHVHINVHSINDVYINITLEVLRNARSFIYSTYSSPNNVLSF